MKKALLFLLLLSATIASAQDAIIFRDGRVKSVKIIQTNNDKTLYKDSENKHVKKVAERIFIAPPLWISCRCNHSLLYKSCIAVHQVDDVGMVLGVLVL